MWGCSIFSAVTHSPSQWLTAHGIRQQHSVPRLFKKLIATRKRLLASIPQPLGRYTSTISHATTISYTISLPVNQKTAKKNIYRIGTGNHITTYNHIYIYHIYILKSLQIYIFSTQFFVWASPHPARCPAPSRPAREGRSARRPRPRCRARWRWTRGPNSRPCYGGGGLGGMVWSWYGVDTFCWMLVMFDASDVSDVWFYVWWWWWC